MRKKASIVIISLFILTLLLVVLQVDSVPAPSISSGDASLTIQSGKVKTGETITVTVTVSNLVNLMSWRIRVFYNISLVNCTAVWLPAQNIFAGKDPFFGSNVGIREGRWCVQAGSSIIPFLYGTFNGTGSLCKINFTARQEVGISALEFCEPYGNYTFLMYATPPNYTETGYISVDEVSNGTIEVVDSPSPPITIVSPENKTYPTSCVPLNFTIKEPTPWIGYSLDDKNNKTIKVNTTLSNLSYGCHKLTIYANETHGQTVTCDTVSFTVRLLADLNSDGAVDIIDVIIVSSAYDTSPEDPNWNELADINQDGQVDILDVTIVTRDYGKT